MTYNIPYACTGVHGGPNFFILALEAKDAPPRRDRFLRIYKSYYELNNIVVYIGNHFVAFLLFPPIIIPQR